MSTTSSNKQIIDDETIAINVRDTLDKLRDSRSAGKRFREKKFDSIFNSIFSFRLRYFREKPVVAARRDGSSHYQHLRFYPVDDNPPTSTSGTNVHFANTVKS